MKNMEPETNAAVESYEPPAWVDEALRLSLGRAPGTSTEARLERPSEAFLRKCQEAADVAADMARLRRERLRVGFVPMSLAEYIQGLAKVAGVRLSPLFARFEVNAAALDSPASARSLARLSREIGIGLREALIHFRIGFVEKIDSVPISLLMAHHRAPGAFDQFGECETVLRLAEAEYESGALEDLRRAEFEVRGAYKEHEP
jgi:hypothetical protein